MKDNSKKNKQSYLPSQTMLLIRMVLGGYLLFLAYDIVGTELLSGRRVVIIALCVIFVISGIILTSISIRSLIKGEYIGGKEDSTEEEELLDK